MVEYFITLSWKFTAKSVGERIWKSASIWRS